MNFMKKTLSFILITIFALSAFAINANAASMESESNDSYATANTLSLNGTISGSMSKYNDVDIFKITATSNGKISLKFNHTYVEKSFGWEINIYYYSDGTYNELTDLNVNLAGSESVSLPSIGAVSGGVYYIKVRTSVYGNRTEAAVGELYSLVSSFSSTEYYEKELNNTWQTATSIKLNSNYSGVINKYDDSDIYKVVASSSSKLTINFKHEYANLNNGWEVDLYYYYNNTYTPIYERQYIALSGSENISLPSIDAIAGLTYYIRVKTSSYGVRTEQAVGRDYSIIVGGTVPVIKYTVTYNANGGVVSPSSATVESGKSVTLPTPSKSGYSCLGWSTSSSATSASYSCGTSYTPSKNITLYAVWKSVPMCKVTYDAKGGTVSPSSVSVELDASIRFPKPVRDGYTFVGWTTDSSAATARYYCDKNYIIKGNTVLYAVWTPEIKTHYMDAKDTFTVKYPDFTPVRYYSDDTNIATITANGMVRGEHRGETSVHAVDAYGNIRTTDIVVNYTFWQWLIIILLFGWIWY